MGWKLLWDGPGGSIYPPFKVFSCLGPNLTKKVKILDENVKNESISSLKMVQKGLKMIQNHSKVIKYNPWGPNLAFYNQFAYLFQT